MNDYPFLDPSLSRRLAHDVEQAECDKLEAYPDSLGNWTCGRGHLMPPAAPGRSWAGFSVIQSTSDRWFNEDLLKAKALAEKWAEFASCDTEARQNALIEIAFNMAGKWGQFEKARAAILAKDWQTAHDQMLDSLWARQVGTGFYPDGKPKRATRLANQILKGEYDDSVVHGP